MKPLLKPITAVLISAFIFSLSAFAQSAAVRYNPADGTLTEPATLDLTGAVTITAADINDATADGIALIKAADANPFTDADESKLDGVEALATADQTSAEILAAFETESGRDVSVDGSKLDGIEALADVTDTANVTSAGALMDSEVDADLKTLSLPASTTISAYGATLADAADAATARTTLVLGNVDNTADADKPISTATQAELDAALARDNARAFAGGVLFDGVDGFVEIDGSILVSEEWTVSAQAKSLDTSESQFVFGSIPTTEGSDYFYIRYDTDNSITVSLRIDGNTVTISPADVFEGVISIAVTCDDTLLKLYVDGDLIDSGDSSGLTLSNWDTSRNLWLGGRNGSSPVYSNIIVRDFACCNIALTATEADELSSDGLEAFIASHPEYQWADGLIKSGASSTGGGDRVDPDTFFDLTTWTTNLAATISTQSVDGFTGLTSTTNVGATLQLPSDDGLRGPNGQLIDGTASEILRFTFDVSNLVGTGYVGLDGSLVSSESVTTIDADGSFVYEFAPDNGGTNARLCFSGDNGTSYDIANFKVEKIGIVAALPLDEGIGYQHRDLSSNHFDALASATGVYHLKTKREGSLRAFGIDAYNGGSGDVELVSSSRDVLPANAIIKESFVRNNGGGSIASGALDVKRSNRTTRNIIGDNGGVLDGGLVENITITAQQTPTYNNVALDASTDADATDIDVRINYELID